MAQVVTAALNWWNELPEDLDRCVRGLAHIADRVVALDGAYTRYPEATPRSSDDQLDAIREAAKAVDLECRIIQPDTLWAGQVEKRSHLLAVASIGSTWIVTVDADHVITANRPDIRTFLQHHPGNVVSVPYITPPNPEREAEDIAVGLWHIQQMAEPQFIPHIWRVLPGMRVEKFHWWYSAIVNGQRHWLWGGDNSYPHIEHQRLRRGYTIEHRTLLRTEEQVRMSRAFLNDRGWVVEMTGQEDDQANLRRPEYSYDLVPW